VDVHHHQHHRQRLQHLQPVNLEPLTDHLEKHSHQDVEVQQRELLQTAALAQTLLELPLVDHIYNRTPCSLKENWKYGNRL
jgi:hypothetical protein